MKVFAGPPGTGKTYAAAREAVRIARPDTPITTFDDPAAFAELHSRLVAQGIIRWVTFHPSYSYEDFVEGFRPHTDESGAISYAPTAGPFLQACAAAKGTVDAAMFTKGQFLGPLKNYEVTDVAADSVFLKSRKKGENKDRFDINIVPFALINFFDQKGVSPADLRHAGSKAKKKDDLPAEERQQAQDQSAESSPENNQPDDPKHYEGRKAAEFKTGLPITFFTNSSPPAAVLEHLHDKRGKSLDVVLVIDEMNRADLSKVMGELITLLEPDKREGAPEERSVILTYSQNKIIVPSTLHIVGTMNTADKSIGNIDLALRRRFEFVLVPPDPQKVSKSFGGINLQKFFAEINQRLSFLSGRDNLLGHADFMASKLKEISEREGYVGQDAELRTLAHVLRSKTVPFLLDLLRSDWSKVQSAIGPMLFSKEKAPVDLFENDSMVDLDDATLRRMDYFWDPASPDWDGERFRKAMSRYHSESKGATAEASVDGSAGQEGDHSSPSS